MRVINAGTEVQIKDVQDLWGDFRRNTLSKYFPEDYLDQLSEAEVLKLPELETIDQADIIQMTIAMQTMIHLLEHPESDERQLELFEKNKRILIELGIPFPFSKEMLTSRNKNKRFH
ncbi:DUF5365 family protein [Thalassobacillus hwangdonensis]|uniref:DUF5365 family protein n=1 Tax=Thalassobacillus hwangdonensis TaxID=546108 RepID=A0ABW3L1D6_9BACI